MKFIINGTAAELASQINNFNNKYHGEFFSTNSFAKKYLSEEPSLKNTQYLAVSLYSTLNSWGAGKRAAPSVNSVESMSEVLLSSDIHNKLVALSKSFDYFSIEKGNRTLKNGSPFKSVREFDEILISTLNDLSNLLLIGNTNVNYPMKLLLLITGLMPALDSQVKGGLAIAGVQGINSTRFLLPKSVTDTNAKKICCLPFYVNDCVRRYADLLNDAVSSSFYKQLLGEHGRIFDVLFFMQNSLIESKSIISSEPTSSSQSWYDI